MTAIESLIAAAAIALDAAPSVAATVVRHQADSEYRPRDCPLVVVRRGSLTRLSDSVIARADWELQIVVHCVVAGADWETRGDALLDDVNAVLVNLPALTALQIELQSVIPQAFDGEETVGQLVATYTVNVRTTAGLQL